MSLNAAEVMDVDVVDLVVDVDEEPEGAGASCCTPLASSDVLRVVAAVGDAAAGAAAVHAAGKCGNLREEDVAVAVAAAAAVVAAVATVYLEVLVQAGRDVEAEAKAGATKPGGKSGCPS